MIKIKTYNKIGNSFINEMNKYEYIGNLTTRFILEGPILYS